MNLIDTLIVAAILGVSITLVLGITNLYRNSDESRTRSNKLMRQRVIFQAVAIVLLVVGMIFKSATAG